MKSVLALVILISSCFPSWAQSTDWRIQHLTGNSINSRGRMMFSSIAPAKCVDKRLTAPAATEVTRTSRLVGDSVNMILSFIPRKCGSARELGRGAKWFERGAKFGTEEFRLFPRGKVAAPIDFVEVNEIAIGAPRPCFRSPIGLPRKDRDGDRERYLGSPLRGRTGDASAAVFPIQP